MASKKDYLRAAILSGGAEGSSEHPSAIVAIQPSNGYVAPANGAVYFNGKANGTGGTAMSIVKNGGLSSAFTAQVDSTWFNSVSLRVRKGDVISFGSYNLSDVHVYFVSLVGGGKNSVAQSLWRVVPCLRSTFDQCLSRTVDHIRACQRQLGLYTKRQRLTLIRRSAMSLKRTVGAQSKRTVRVTQHMLSATSKWSRSRLQQVLSEVGGLACLSKRRRAIHTCIALQQATEDQRRLPWSYSRTSDHNFCFGGASHG